MRLSRLLLVAASALVGAGCDARSASKGSALEALGIVRTAEPMPTLAPPTPVPSLSLDAGPDAADAGLGAPSPESSGLLGTLRAPPGRLGFGKDVTLTLTLQNKSKGALEVALPDARWSVGKQLVFWPPLAFGAPPHGLEQGYFPGSVRLVAPGARVTLAVTLRRTRAGDALCIPIDARDSPARVASATADGCQQVLSLPAPWPSQVEVRFQLEDTAETWSNVRFTGKRWTGRLVTNGVKIAL